MKTKKRSHAFSFITSNMGDGYIQWTTLTWWRKIAINNRFFDTSSTETTALFYRLDSDPIRISTTSFRLDKARI